MNKELIEKIEKEIGTYSNDLTKSMATRIARIASEHYGDKWHKCSEGMPEEGHECVIMIAGMRGTAIYTEVNGIYQFVNENYEGSCAELEQDAITHWMSITELSQPPTTINNQI